jgi:hypothetical protein
VTETLPDDDNIITRVYDFVKGDFYMTTKEQERTALNKIRDILGTLDADSWVNTAFKGVCDIAQENIDNDFACSPVERVKSLEKELKTTQNSMESWKSDAVHYKGEYEALKEAYDKIQLKALNRGNLIEKFRQIFGDDLEDANDTILEYCEKPDSIEFKKAVSARQDAQYWLNEIDDVQ